jgi:hypothetical protein
MSLPVCVPGEQRCLTATSTLPVARVPVHRADPTSRGGGNLMKSLWAAGYRRHAGRTKLLMARHGAPGAASMAVMQPHRALMTSPSRGSSVVR